MKAVENGTNTSKDSRAPSSVNADAYKIGPLGSEPLIKADVDIPNQNLLPTSNSLRLQDHEKRMVNLEHQMRSRITNENKSKISNKKFDDDIANKINQMYHEIVTSVVYTYVDRKNKTIKFGHSYKFDKRNKTHIRSGLEYVDHCSGAKIQEDQLLGVLRASGLKPKRHTLEEFDLVPKVLELATVLNWPLGDNPQSLLKRSKPEPPPNQYILEIH